MRYADNVVDRQRSEYTGRCEIRSRRRRQPASPGPQNINSRPFHPQTCDKIERFWQTLKRWLRAANDDHARAAKRPARAVPQLLQPPTTTSGTRGAAPAKAFADSEKARPAEWRRPATVFVTRDTVREQNRQPDSRAVQGQRRTAMGRNIKRQHTRRRPQRHLQRDHQRARTHRQPQTRKPARSTKRQEHTTNANP